MKNRKALWVGIIALEMLAAAPGSLFASPIITVGSHDLLPNTANQVVTFSVSGGDLVQGLDFRLQVADGFPEVPGSTEDGPNITAVDIVGVGNIFNGNNTGQTDNFAFDQIWSVFTTTASGTVAANGVFAKVTFDTTGFTAPQQWDLLFSGTFDGDTDFGPVSANITNGTIQIPATNSSINLGAAAEHTNLATGGSVVVTGSNGSYFSEIDPLTGNANIGSAGILNAGDGLANNDVFVMLWLTEQETGQISSLLSSLDADGGAVYDVLPPSDPRFIQLQASYPGFATLVQFFDPAPNFGPINPGFFNWDFVGNPGVQVDQIAVVPEPASMVLLTLGGLVMARRRKA